MWTGRNGLHYPTMDTPAVNFSSNSAYSVEATATKAREAREAFAARSNEVAQENKQKSETRNTEAVQERKTQMAQLQASGSNINTYA